MIAKPIIKDKYWVVVDGSNKVGNVTLNDLGYNVTLNGRNKIFLNQKELKQEINITFQKISINRKVNIPFSQYPTTNRVYNSMMDIKKKLHLFTKTKKSKCYYVAGWFVLNHNENKKVILCPKYIFIQRYNYIGPFKTKLEAEQQLNI